MNFSDRFVSERAASTETVHWTHISLHPLRSITVGVNGAKSSLRDLEQLR